jgi:hypothetical protein
MWSVGGAVLVWIVLCAAAVALAVRRFRRELGTALRSFELLHGEVTLAVERTDRDAGRAHASRRVLLRHGTGPAGR